MATKLPYGEWEKEQRRLRRQQRAKHKTAEQMNRSAKEENGTVWQKGAGEWTDGRTHAATEARAAGVWQPKAPAASRAPVPEGKSAQAILRALAQQAMATMPQPAEMPKAGVGGLRQLPVAQMENAQGMKTPAKQSENALAGQMRQSPGLRREEGQGNTREAGRSPEAHAGQRAEREAGGQALRREPHFWKGTDRAGPEALPEVPEAWERGQNSDPDAPLLREIIEALEDEQGPSTRAVVEELRARQAEMRRRYGEEAKRAQSRRKAPAGQMPQGKVLQRAIAGAGDYAQGEEMMAAWETGRMPEEMEGQFLRGVERESGRAGAEQTEERSDGKAAPQPGKGGEQRRERYREIYEALLEEGKVAPTHPLSPREMALILERGQEMYPWLEPADYMTEEEIEMARIWYRGQAEEELFGPGGRPDGMDEGEYLSLLMEYGLAEHADAGLVMSAEEQQAAMEWRRRQANLALYGSESAPREMERGFYVMQLMAHGEAEWGDAHALLIEGDLEAYERFRLKAQEQLAQEIWGTAPEDFDPDALTEGEVYAIWCRAADVYGSCDEYLLTERQREQMDAYYESLCSQDENGEWTGADLFGESEEPYIKSRYGWRDQSGAGRGHEDHRGVDIAGVALGTDIQSIWHGEVVATGFDKDNYGHYIVIKTKDAEGQDCYLYLMHMKNDVAYEKGDIIAPGMVIGQVGSSGDSKGPHLHFEVRTEPPKEGDIHANRNSAVNPSALLGRYAHGTITAGDYEKYNNKEHTPEYDPDTAGAEEPFWLTEYVR